MAIDFSTLLPQEQVQGPSALPFDPSMIPSPLPFVPSASPAPQQAAPAETESMRRRVLKAALDHRLGRPSRGQRLLRAAGEAWYGARPNTPGSQAYFAHEQSRQKRLQDELDYLFEIADMMDKDREQERLTREKGAKALSEQRASELVDVGEATGMPQLKGVILPRRELEKAMGAAVSRGMTSRLDPLLGLKEEDLASRVTTRDARTEASVGSANASSALSRARLPGAQADSRTKVAQAEALDALVTALRSGKDLDDPEVQELGKQLRAVKGNAPSSGWTDASLTRWSTSQYDKLDKKYTKGGAFGTNPQVLYPTGPGQAPTMALEVGEQPTADQVRWRKEWIQSEIDSLRRRGSLGSFSSQDDPFGADEELDADEDDYGPTGPGS